MAILSDYSSTTVSQVLYRDVLALLKFKVSLSEVLLCFIKSYTHTHTTLSLQNSSLYAFPYGTQLSLVAHMLPIDSAKAYGTCHMLLLTLDKCALCICMCVWCLCVCADVSVSAGLPLPLLVVRHF